MFSARSHYRLLLTLALAGVSIAWTIGRGPSTEDLERSRAFYESRPLEERPQAWWQEVPEGLEDLRAASCGECHPDIYEEWRVSTHGQAWTDRQFQVEIAKSENRWLCRNCHTPLMNQMPLWAVGLEQDDVERPAYVENVAFDPELRDEGITCASCHVRDGAIEGPTGIATDAHPTRRAERFDDETICLTCHQAVRRYPGKDFICVFETGSEWREGPYSARPCQACHMQAVFRPQAVGEPPRHGRRHYWPGAGIYKVEGVGPPLDQLGFGLGVEVESDAELLTVTLSNGAAGHLLPTGDPERHITVEVSFLDAAGDSLGAPHQERIGQVWEWWPEPRKLSDNRLEPFEERIVTIDRPLGATVWSLVATSHRISQEVIDYHRLHGYPSSRVTHRLTGALPSVAAPLGE